LTEYLEVGKIVNTQGIKGEVRVISKTDFPAQRYQKGAQLTLFSAGKEPLPLTVTSHRKHKNFDILAFDGYPSINDVEDFREGILKVNETDLNNLAEDEFYYYEIIGLTVRQNEQFIGTVKEILALGANDVWVIQRKNKKDLLLPYLKSVVKEIDLDNGFVNVEIPEGLVENED